jgi:hypothetical protein
VNPRSIGLCICILSWVALSTPSKETYVFDRGFRPNQVYTSVANLTNEMSMKAPGGIGMMSGTAVQHFRFTTRAGSVGNDGRFDLTMAFEKGVTTVDMGGMKQSIDMTDQLQKLRIRASCSAEGTVESVDVQGSGVDDMLKQLGSQLLKDNQIGYPDHPMAVGETFEQVTPLEIPLQGMGASINGKVEAEYKLVSVAGDLATLEVALSIGLASETQEGSGFKLEGEGSGMIVYSFSDQFERSFNQKTRMKANVTTAGSSFAIEVDSYIDQTNTVSPSGD